MKHLLKLPLNKDSVASVNDAYAYIRPSVFSHLLQTSHEVMYGQGEEEPRVVDQLILILTDGTRLELDADQLEYITETINSALAPVYSINGSHVARL